MKILLIEDHQPLLNIVKDGLTAKGFSIDCAIDGEEGLWLAQSNPYDAIILDLMLPKLNGLELLEKIRTEGKTVPVLILTARGEIKQRVAGLNKGADDYLVKPFAFPELVARIHALVRRSHNESKNVIEIANFKIDLLKRLAWREDEAIRLSKREFSLLEYLVLHKEQVVSKIEILEGIFDFNDEKSVNLIEVYIGYLRRKIDDRYEPKLIHTCRGQGFIFGVREE